MSEVQFVPTPVPLPPHQRDAIEREELAGKLMAAEVEIERLQEAGDKIIRCWDADNVRWPMELEIEKLRALLNAPTRGGEGGAMTPEQIAHALRGPVVLPGLEMDAVQEYLTSLENTIMGLRAEVEALKGGIPRLTNDRLRSIVREAERKNRTQADELNDWISQHATAVGMTCVEEIGDPDVH